jgi:hypothetical protein
LEEKDAHKGNRTPWTLREFGGQTVWDWLHLLSALAIPVVLAAAGLWFTAQQDQRQVAIEEQRAEAERELAEQRAQDEALQAYLNQMSQLMLERKLLEAEPGDPVHTLAQARSSTVILRLDAAHNESVTRFLINSGLAVHSDPGIVVVTGPHVRSEASHVRSEASARLLSRIALPHATLSGAQLYAADLIGADLRGAVLTEANLSGANLSGAQLSFANLKNAYLVEANLRDATLVEANLKNAYLSGADLKNAYLSGADLEKADGITNEELDRQAASLEGATMPNGQKYEEWLKDK